MSQFTALRALDAKIMRGMQSAGIADAATYLPKGAAPDTIPTPCAVYVDRDVSLYGDDGAEVATVHTVITFFRSQVEPHRGAQVTIDPAGDAEVFKLEAEISHDESRARWTVAK